MPAIDRPGFLHRLAAARALQQQFRLAAIADLLSRILRLEGAMLTDEEGHESFLSGMGNPASGIGIPDEQIHIFSLSPDARILNPMWL
jgi:hypothetical protein